MSKSISLDQMNDMLKDSENICELENSTEEPISRKYYINELLRETDISIEYLQSLHIKNLVDLYIQRVLVTKND